MNGLQKLIVTLGIEPTIALAIFVLFSMFLILITILYICVPFFLIRIRKEIIELNRNLRSFIILQTQTKVNGNAKTISNEDKNIYKEKSSADLKKLQLDDNDITKLKTLGYGMSNKDET